MLEKNTAAYVPNGFGEDNCVVVTPSGESIT